MQLSKKMRVRTGHDNQMSVPVVKRECLCERHQTKNERVDRERSRETAEDCQGHINTPKNVSFAVLRPWMVHYSQM